MIRTYYTCMYLLLNRGVMSCRERSSTASPSTEGASTTCSSTSGSQCTRSTQPDDDDFVMVKLNMEERLREEPTTMGCSLPRVRFHTSDPREGVDIAMGESSLAASEPLTVAELMQRTVVRVPQHVALRYKTRDKWSDITYREYYNLCITAAKSFIRLGLQPFQTVMIVGFNSPQWLISALGCIFAGGLSCGVYSTIGKDELHQIARKVHTAVAVVETHSMLCKFLLGKIQGKLPELKAIVQYRGALVEEHSDVYDWDQFMAVGGDMTTWEIEQKMKERTPNQCATLVYTAGTTGDPKTVMLSHDNLTWSAKSLMLSYKAIEYAAEHTVSYLPLSHIAAQMLDIYVAITIAATVHFAQPDALKGSLGRTLKEVQPTMFFGVPRVYSKMMEGIQEACQGMSGVQKIVSEWAMRKGLKGNMNKQSNVPVPWGWTVANYVLFKRVKRELGFQRCKIFAVGGAITRTEIYEYLMSLNIPMMNFYGMSESCGAHCVNQSTEDHWKVGSAGKSIMAVSTKLHDTDGNGEGEICFSGRHVFMGYLGDETRTASVIDRQGWLHTGDIGKFDENGFLHVTGRTADVIVLRGGETVLPLAIENHILRELPFLSHVVVVGENRPYLTCIMTLSCVMDAESGEPTDTLAPLAQSLMGSLGSTSGSVSGIINSRDRPVFAAITEGLERANTLAPTTAHRIQKWTLLDRDFSIPGGELGPTLKVRRFIVHKKYATTIETLYRN